MYADAGYNAKAERLRCDTRSFDVIEIVVIYTEKNSKLQEEGGTVITRIIFHSSGQSQRQLCSRRLGRVHK